MHHQHQQQKNKKLCGILYSKVSTITIYPTSVVVAGLADDINQVTAMKIAIYSHSIAPSIDGVCRRFTGILHELVQAGHEVILFTLEEEASELPDLLDIVWLDYMYMPAYPDKKVAKPDFHSFFQIMRTLRKYSPDVVHVTADGISQVFALAGMLLGIPIVASFHTDILDLLTSHNANFFQRFCITFKESVDSFVLDSCATTSSSFAVCVSTLTYVM
jgi:glycosyltransferase involved in cell wall biosynthesis